MKENCPGVTSGIDFPKRGVNEKTVWMPLFSGAKLHDFCSKKTRSFVSVFRFL